MEKLTTLQKINIQISTSVAYARRTFRVMDVSMFDYIGSYIAIYIILYVTNTPQKLIYYVAMLPIAVIVHIIFGQRTTVTREITNNSINISKLYLIFLTVLWAYLYNYDV